MSDNYEEQMEMEDAESADREHELQREIGAERRRRAAMIAMALGVSATRINDASMSELDDLVATEARRLRALHEDVEAARPRLASMMVAVGGNPIVAARETLSRVTELLLPNVEDLGRREKIADESVAEYRRKMAETARRSEQRVAQSYARQRRAEDDLAAARSELADLREQMRILAARRDAAMSALMGDSAALGPDTGGRWRLVRVTKTRGAGEAVARELSPADSRDIAEKRLAHVLASAGCRDEIIQRELECARARLERDLPATATIHGAVQEWVVVLPPITVAGDSRAESEVES